MSKTEFTLAVVRTIKTDEFESLHITAQIKEEMEWDGEEERSIAADRAVAHLNGDFIKSYRKIMETTGIQRSIGTATHKKNGVVVGKGNVTTDDEVDIFG